MAQNLLIRSIVLLSSAASLAVAAPPVIDDSALIASFQNGIGRFAGKEGNPTGEDLAKSVRKPGKLSEKIQLPDGAAAASDYETLSDSVFMVGSVYKCDKCDHWHSGGVATAWCLTEDGLMVTNAHVFAKAKGAAMGICDRKGNCHPVTAVLASDANTDVALFRVAGKGFKPLRLGEAAPVGTEISVISHPDQRYFTRTSGEISRYSSKPGRGKNPAVTWMSITADYAKGSSGGPVFNPAGEVVGMVSSTQTIYYGSPDGKEQGPVQMVVKNCVQADSIRQLIDGPVEVP